MTDISLAWFINGISALLAGVLCALVGVVLTVLSPAFMLYGIGSYAVRWVKREIRWRM